MIRFASTALCFGLLLLAAPVHAGVENWQFEIEGQSRVVRVHVPEGPSPTPRRFVVVFHGLGDRYDLFSDAVELHKDWPDAIVAYPNGETRPDRKSMRGWQVRAGQYDDRDLQLVDKLLTQAAERHGVGPESTHAAGFSNGGHMVMLLLAERADAFASFAVLGAVGPELAGASTPKPLLYLFGRGEGAELKEPWAETIKAMIRVNRTTGGLSDYASCCKLQKPAPGGAPFVFGLYNAGHTWPHRGNDWLKSFFEQDWDSVSANP